MDSRVSNTYYYRQIEDIDRQIEELEARKAAMLSYSCFIGYDPGKKTYIDPYRLDEKFSKESSGQ